ncbi:unnamed protein product, partial [marine sediment metagenome]
FALYQQYLKVLEALEAEDKATLREIPSPRSIQKN